jgi:cyclic beta-1,2-glucan synthetase
LSRGHPSWLVRWLRAPVDPLPDSEDPIRGELFGIERLEEHAESLAKAQHVSGTPRRGRRLLPRLAENGRVLLECYRSLAVVIREEQAITPAAEWLVDNFHIVDDQLREIREDLPRAYYRQLPKLTAEFLAGYPRVFGIAWAFVAHTDSRIEPEALRRFVAAYQKVQPLLIGELWAIPITVRVVLVENLRRLAERIVRDRRGRQEADELADRLVAATPGMQTKAAPPYAAPSPCGWCSGCATRIPTWSPRCPGWTNAWRCRGRPVTRSFGSNTSSRRP